MTYLDKFKSYDGLKQITKAISDYLRANPNTSNPAKLMNPIASEMGFSDPKALKSFLDSKPWVSTEILCAVGSWDEIERRLDSIARKIQICGDVEEKAFWILKKYWYADKHSRADMFGFYDFFNIEYLIDSPDVFDIDNAIHFLSVDYSHVYGVDSYMSDANKWFLSLSPNCRLRKHDFPVSDSDGELCDEQAIIALEVYIEAAQNILGRMHTDPVEFDAMIYASEELEYWYKIVSYRLCHSKKLSQMVMNLSKESSDNLAFDTTEINKEIKKAISEVFEKNKIILGRINRILPSEYRMTSEEFLRKTLNSILKDIEKRLSLSNSLYVAIPNSPYQIDVRAKEKMSNPNHPSQIFTRKWMQSWDEMNYFVSNYEEKDYVSYFFSAMPIFSQSFAHFYHS